MPPSTASRVPAARVPIPASKRTSWPRTAPFGRGLAPGAETRGVRFLQTAPGFERASAPRHRSRLSARIEFLPPTSGRHAPRAPARAGRRSVADAEACRRGRWARYHSIVSRRPSSNVESANRTAVRRRPAPRQGARKLLSRRGRGARERGRGRRPADWHPRCSLASGWLDQTRWRVPSSWTTISPSGWAWRKPSAGRVSRSRRPAASPRRGPRSRPPDPTSCSST